MNIAITMMRAHRVEGRDRSDRGDDDDPQRNRLHRAGRERRRALVEGGDLQGPPEDREKRPPSRGAGGGDAEEFRRQARERRRGREAEAQPVASSQMRLFEIAVGAQWGSTSRWTSEVSDCSRRRTPARDTALVEDHRPMAAPALDAPELARIASMSTSREKGGPRRARGASAQGAPTMPVDEKAHDACPAARHGRSRRR